MSTATNRCWTAPVSEPGQDAGGGHRRKDAVRNHERVVAAAVAAFREHGSEVSVPQVAARAGVGKATVYRSFPTKEDLLEAVTRLSLDELRRRAAAGRPETDPDVAFRRYVLELFDALAGDRLLAERLSDPSSAAAGTILRTLVAAMGRAQAAGTIRADAVELDLRVLLCGAALQLLRLGETDPATWRRYGAMVLTALQP
jgi:AcrR family transcriptional regulator